MKRLRQLQPLSRQHHNGLLAALLLRKGIAKNADGNVMGTFILDFWKQDLKEHFESEEKLLLPALSDKKLNERLLQEHTSLRSYISSLRNNPSLSIIESFSKLLEQHIRFEE